MNPPSDGPRITASAISSTPAQTCSTLNRKGSSEDYWTQLAVIAVGYVGYPRSAPAAYITRTLTTSGDSTGDVDPKSLTPPTAGELEIITRYLDEAGFTGDRTVRLLLTAYEV